MLKKLIIVAACCSILAAAGCANIQAKSQVIQLQDRTRAYRKAIRWSEFEVASNFIRHRDAGQYSYDGEFLKGIKVTMMEITEHDVRLDDNEARVTSELSFYHEDGGVVREMVDRQTWWYDPAAEQWYLDGTFPDFAGNL